MQLKQTSDAITHPEEAVLAKETNPAHLDLHKLLFFLLVVLGGMTTFDDANVTYIKIFSCVLIFICFYDCNHSNNSSISIFTVTQDKQDTYIMFKKLKQFQLLSSLEDKVSSMGLKELHEGRTVQPACAGLILHLADMAQANIPTMVMPKLTPTSAPLA